MTVKLLLVKSENGLETRQDYDGLSSANPAFTGALTGGSAALTGDVDAGGEIKSGALVGPGARPVVALADGTFDDQDAATFRGTIGAGTSSLALGSDSTTAHRGDHGTTAYSHSQATGNPHGTTAADVGALAKITLTGTIDSQAINGGAPGLYDLHGSVYTNFPGSWSASAGGTLLQTVAKNGRILQELHSEINGKMIQTQTGPTTWSGWTRIWDNGILPVSPTGLAVVSAANQAAARATIGAAPLAGVTDGSNAASGVVGQYYEAFLPEASFVYAVNGSPVAVLSLSLPAGDWLVEGRATAHITGAMNGNKVVSGLNTSIAIPTDGTEVYGGLQVFSATNGFQTMTGSKRFSLTATTTVYLVARIDFSAGTPALFGCMSARRMR